MARRSRSKARRDTSVIANDFRSLLSPLEPVRSGLLSEIEDRRFFSPLSVDRRKSSRRWAVKVVQRPNRLVSRVYRPGFYFESPRHVVACVRRKRRKEVIHAKGIAGRRGLRRGRRNQWSSVRC